MGAEMGAGTLSRMRLRRRGDRSFGGRHRGAEGSSFCTAGSLSPSPSPSCNIGISVPTVSWPTI